METTLPTNQGPMTISQIFDHLNYSSYCVQRDAGMSHERLAKWDCYNNPNFKTKYDATHKK